MKIAVLINYRDRPTELSLLLESLRHQTYKNFKIYILDDFSGTPVSNYHFLMVLFNKINEEGNFIEFQRNDFNLGVSKSRQKIADMALKDDWADLFLRVDDDVILESDFMEKLLKGINEGYDLMSGTTPFIGQPQFKRESRFIQPIGNRVILDQEGNFIMNNDDFGMDYLDEVTLPIHHFRSSALYKKEIHEKVNYDSKLSKHGFREEEIFSFKCILNGFKLGANTKAIAWHLLTPSGGERFPDSADMIKLNEEILKDFTKQMYKEHGDFISEYNKKLGIHPSQPSNEELLKSTNLIRI